MGESSKPNQEKIILEDRVVRLIGIPFFGLVIPSATGLIKLNEFSFEHALHYLYFMMVAWVIWEGNRFLLYRNYPVIFKSQSVFQKYLLITSQNIFYTAPVSFILLYGWRWLMGINWVSDQIIINNVILIVVCVIFVTNVYEKALFTKQSDREKVKLEQLERGKVQAELEALKNQIDPHFMFNALNNLSYLIDHDSKRAQKFINNLAEVYRYILRSKNKDLVLLQEELSFLESYRSLLELRYGTAFKMELKLNGLPLSDYLLPPVSIMVAVENAVKHNEISKRNQLILHVECKDYALRFTNKISHRKFIKDSTKTGLENLNERFKRLSGKEIQIENNTGYFCLTLPLLKLNR